MGILDQIKGKLGNDGFKPNPAVLTHPEIPKPLHGLAPRVLLGKEWWDKERAEAKAKTGNRCLACGVYGFQSSKGWLEGHETYEIDYKKGIAVYVATIPLCPECHSFIHKGLLTVLEEKGEISKVRKNEILGRGYDLLKKAGIKPPLPYVGKCAEWEEWRLILEGKVYLPFHKSYADWIDYYSEEPPDV